jgi:hypothetical protein
LSSPTPEGRALLVQGVLNDFTRLYWRSSIGLPMQQLKPGGGGGGSRLRITIGNHPLK